MGRFSGKRCRLISMLALTGSFFLVEMSVGYITNSMALVADSFHMLSDVAALVVAFLSVKMSPKKWSKNTFGWARAEVLGALVNSVFLVALCFSILIESLNRFYEPKEIHEPQLLLAVGFTGLVVNIIGLVLFHDVGHSHSHSHDDHNHNQKSPSPLKKWSRSAEVLNAHMAEEDKQLVQISVVNGRLAPCGAAGAEEAETQLLTPNGVKGRTPSAKSEKSGHGGQMNMRGVFLHIMADALGSVIVCASAIIVWQTEWEYKLYVDPCLSLVMACLIIRSTWPLLVESAMILLQTVPTHIEVGAIQKKILTEIEGVLDVHEFHVWQLTGDKVIASAHIRCENANDYSRIAENMKGLFHDQGIHSTTIQPEFMDSKKPTLNTCTVNCPATDPKCNSADMCCPHDMTSSQNNVQHNDIRQNDFIQNDIKINDAIQHDVTHNDVTHNDVIQNQYNQQQPAKSDEPRLINIDQETPPVDKTVQPSNVSVTNLITSELLDLTLSSNLTGKEDALTDSGDKTALAEAVAV